ncbi:MAG: class I SAM-dependent methyltransferase [Bdellovibrionia bacterium]
MGLVDSFDYQKIGRTLAEIPLVTFSSVRSAHYKLTYEIMNRMSRFIPGLQPPQVPDEALTKEISKRVFELLRQDVRNALEGLYPLSVFQPESPFKHLRRTARIIFDGVGISRRRKARASKEFSKQARSYLEDVPEYYRRNFHFQTDGYLSDWSADLYDHQVELLFGGTADAMRRLMIKPMKEHFKKNPDGRGLTFMEFGSGTGRSTRNIRLAFPQARIVSTDLSEPYLKAARTRLEGYKKLDFVRADAGDLPFADSKFDAVYSVFTLHETPFEARKKILAEAHRVLKPGGFMGLIDTAQLGDVPELDGIFKNFPTSFHEPFYMNYIKTPIEKLLKAAKFKNIHSEIGLFSKVTTGKK